jgi:pyridoxal phosphate-dependent aminotransferase EpsN
LTGTTPEAVRQALAARDIEARPLWKPMHLQPVFAEARHRLTGVADRLFQTGLCLPSGSALTDLQIEDVAGHVRRALGA